MSIIKSTLFILIVLCCNFFNFSFLTNCPNYIQAQDCFKGGVYEVNIQYKYPKGKESSNRDYKKIFYLHEEKSNPGFITLFELVPLVINTPNFEKGGLKVNERFHYVIGGYCNHKWDGQHIFLPQSKHLGQVRLSNGMNNYLISSKRDYTNGDACPVSLYFYGYYHNSGLTSPAIQDTSIGLMSLEEHKVINLKTVTIISDIHKLDWSDDYVKTLFNFSQLLVARFNNIIEKRKLNNSFYETTPALYINVDNPPIYEKANKLGTKLKNEWRTKDEFFTQNRTEYFNQFFDYPKPEWPNLFPLVKDTCTGYSAVLYNLNGFIDTREVLWDLFNGSTEFNRVNYQSEIANIKSEYVSLEKEILPLFTKKTIIDSLLNKVKKIKLEVNTLNSFFYSGNKDRLFVSIDSINLPTIIYDDLLYKYKHIHENNNILSQIKVKELKPLLLKEGNYPRASAYNIISTKSEDYKYYSIIKETLKSIQEHVKDLINNISISNSIFDGFIDKESFNSNINSLKYLNTDSSGAPRYLEKSIYRLYNFDTSLVNRSFMELMLSDISRVIDFISDSHRAKDYDLDKTDIFLEKNISETSSNIISQLQKDPKIGAKVVAYVFVLKSSNITGDSKKLANYINDGDIPELLSKLYKIDENDIEDELELITETKLLADLKLDQINLEGYKLLGYTRIDQNHIDNSTNKYQIIDLLNSIEDNITTFGASIGNALNEKKSVLKQIAEFNQNVESFFDKKVNYISSKNVESSNIPQVDYNDICTFLNNYNLSRGLQADLFKSGNLRTNYIDKLIEFQGKSILILQNQSQARYGNLITYEPLSSTWNVVSYSEYFDDQYCKGIGNLHISGFLLEKNHITLKTVFLGDFVKK